MSKTTLAPIYRDLMRVGNYKGSKCFICGATEPLNDHHIVFRSQGELYENGEKVPKPIITLCGFGNNLSAGAKPYCHGLAHHRLLHFKAVKESDSYSLYFLITKRPTKYLDALELSGWRKVESL